MKRLEEDAQQKQETKRRAKKAKNEKKKRAGKKGTKTTNRQPLLFGSLGSWTPAADFLSLKLLPEIAASLLSPLPLSTS
jgi:hypothetical protein